MDREPTITELQGDFESVVKRFQKPLVNYMYRMVRNEETAMDLAQDVFVKAYRARDNFDGRSKVSTWLFSIAVNHGRDYLKMKRHEVELAFEDGAEVESAAEFSAPISGPEGEALTGELGRALEKALAALPADYRETIVMRHVNGMSLEEIAVARGVPEGTVKAHLFRAREKMQQILTKSWGNPT